MQKFLLVNLKNLKKEAEIKAENAKKAIEELKKEQQLLKVVLHIKLLKRVVVQKLKQEKLFQFTTQAS